MAATDRPPLVLGIEEVLQRAQDAFFAGDDPTAARWFRTAVDRAPDHPDALHGLGLACFRLGRVRDAVDWVGAAHRRAPTDDEIQKNLAILLVELWRLEEARSLLEDLDRRRPEDPVVMGLLGCVLGLMGRHEEGHPWLELAEARDPGRPERRPELIRSRAAVCAWRGYAEDRTRLNDDVMQRRAGGAPPLLSPFAALTLDLPEPTVRTLALDLARALRGSAGRAAPPPRRRPGRLRVGYLSPDLHHHPVGLLMAPILEAHDRDRFEIRAYALRTVADPTRSRIEAAVDETVSLDDLDEAEAAERIRADDLDLLVDLAGFTSGGLPGALARRPARVQAHFLGYPGTLGRDLVDYQILHASRIAPGRRDAYDEALALLPETFIASEGFAEPERVPSRAELGLPEDAVVLGFFGAAYRIEPKVFDAWMHILKTSPDAVLWIQNGHPQAQANLRLEAKARGISPHRLFFADWGLLSERWHHTRADLWLDGWHVSSGTASIVAAWTGTPLLTLAGSTPQSRTGAGVLTGAGRPELVADSSEVYVERAVAWTRNPSELEGLRARLLAERDAVPLFRVQTFTRDLEAAYLEMIARAESGRDPEDIEVVRRRPDSSPPPPSSPSA